MPTALIAEDEPLLAQALHTHLASRQARSENPVRGAVVNLLDQKLWNQNPDFLSYTLSKAALEAANTMLAMALAPRIRVNGIGPGPTLPSPRQTQAQFDAQSLSMPLGRGTTPAEICDAVRFVLAAPAMTGQMIALDGGQHMGWGQVHQNAQPED